MKQTIKPYAHCSRFRSLDFSAPKHPSMLAYVYMRLEFRGMGVEEQKSECDFGLFRRVAQCI